MTGTEGDANAVNNNAMTSAQLDRQMEIRAPSAQYNIPPTVTPNSSTVRGTTRDNPGYSGRLADVTSVTTRCLLCKEPLQKDLRYIGIIKLLKMKTEVLLSRN